MGLVRPDPAYEASYREAIAEFQAEGRYPEVSLEEPGSLAAAERDWTPSGTQVPMTTWWLVEGAGYIGRVSIRHRLNDKLLRIGGHIGYDVRPSRRREGHGGTLLRLALPLARGLGIGRALLTCDEDNVASRKIIEAHGGVLEDVQDGKLRFWITITPCS